MIGETTRIEENIMNLITGAAGFIGYHLCVKLLDRGEPVIGIDNMDNYYDVQLKKDRLQQIENRENFWFIKQDICDLQGLQNLFKKNSIDRVCHLAAQVGVRYSLKNPEKYQQSNIQGFLNLLECVKNCKLKNLVYASSSSVYGANNKIPFSETDRVDSPISFYGATKRANELMAYTYHHLYRIPLTGLRFFTVYGPWMRPDMALFLFTQKILAGGTIDIYGQGKMKRNFTYIDDIIQGVLLAFDQPQEYAIYNIGGDHTEELESYINILEKYLGIKAKRNYLPQQPGDMEETWADLQAIRKDLGYQPTTDIEEGIAHFIKWYKEYYKIGSSSHSI